MTTFDPPQDDAALAELLRDQRFGPPAPGEATPWDFVAAWPADYVARHAWPVISRLLIDDDADVRARAVEFANGWLDGRAVAPARLLEAAENRPELFAAQDVDGITLRMRLAAALANVATSLDGRRVARAILRLVADEPMWTGPATVVGQFDPVGAGGYVRRVGAAAVDAARAASEAIARFRRDDLVGYLQTIRTLPSSLKERILSTVESAICRDDAKAAAMAKAFGLPAPQRPAPSSAECRAALGL